MGKYIPIDELVSNENVVHVFSEAKLPGEGDLFLEVVETSNDKDTFYVYVVPGSYDSSTDSLTFLASVTKEKEGSRIKQWYINFEGIFKESF